jgi:hypothetical protein
MTIKQQVEGLAKPMHVGDALTRTIEIDAAQTQSMMIPPPSLTAPDGVRIDKKDPQLTDRKDDRGQFEGGRRVDVVTYRFERPGSYTLPKVSVSWFDPGTQKTQQVETPEIQVTVVAAPEPLLGILVVAWLIRHWPARIRGFVAARRQARHESEGAYFERLLAACRANDPARSYAALAAWVQRTGQTSIGGYVQASADEALERQVTELEQHLYASATSAGQWSGIALASALEVARHASLQRRPEPRRSLSALNPIGGTGRC